MVPQTVREAKARRPEEPFEWKELDVSPKAASATAAAAAPASEIPTPSNASREDLVQFARDHAAYYAAQGVPQQEAMVYISNKVREVVAAQEQRREAHLSAAARGPVPEPAPPVIVARPQPQPLPLVLKLQGPVPTTETAADDEEYESGGRRKKVSSESKEVEEYMKRRQSALGSSEAGAAPHAATAAAHAERPKVSFDDNETMLV